MTPQQPLPAPRPHYVFRAHASAVHGVQFSDDNRRMLSADADGWIICWDLAYKRAVARWQAHGAESNNRNGGDTTGSNAVLGLAWWGTDGVMSHGRDGLIKFWELDPSRLPLMNLTSPAASDSIPSSPTPAIVHSLAAPTVNFCSFAYCLSHHSTTTDRFPPIHVVASSSPTSFTLSVYSLTHPSAPECLSTIPPMTRPDVGMAMALALTDPKTVIAGFESGHVVVWHRSSGNWPVSYLSRPHTQPILSLALHPNRKTFVTSSADAIIAKHLIPSLPTEEIDVEEVFTSHAPELSEPLEILKTKHAGQQGLSIRGDGKLLCSTGWDARGRVYVYGSSSEPTSTSETIQRKKMKEIAVLAWHKGSVFCSAFSNLSIGSDTVQPDTVKISEDGLEVTEETRWKDVSLSTRREKEIQEKKLIVLGGKDGKVSLWEMDVS